MTAPHSYDVLVVGTGIAGLSAALAAAEGGASVAIVERAVEGEHGGNTRYTEAFLRMKSVSEVSDDFEDRLADMSGYHLDHTIVADTERPGPVPSFVRAANMLTPSLIATFAEQAPEALAWLERQGIRFAEASTPFLTASTTRIAPVGGGLALVETLTARCHQRGIPFLFSTTAQDLLCDQDGGIAGLLVSSSGGRRAVAAPVVVLACGGFEGNSEMLARYLPSGRFARPVARGGYYNRGEGIEMALRRGAASAGDYNLFHAEPIDPRSGAPEAAIFGFTYGILVNRDGHRFVDEATGTSDATYEAVTRQILEQPGGIAYAVFDQGIADVPNFAASMRTDQPPITADTPAALAAALGLPLAAWESTLATYNAACTAGTYDPTVPDGLATGGLTPPKSNWARPLDRPGYLAYPVISANVFTFGGVKVDDRARVLDTDGRPIPGLFAAGEVMGIYYGTYTGSTSVLRGAVFGRLAGVTGAQECKR
ncbi:MAG: FAD-dependent oxidoreductase [Frankiales bacterium]|nr:FAD-dependent oxidoreductase [Frankiales bacterium]